MGRMAEFINWSEPICDKADLRTEVDASTKGHVKTRMGICDHLCACHLRLSVGLLMAHVLLDTETKNTSLLCVWPKGASVLAALNVWLLNNVKYKNNMYEVYKWSECNDHKSIILTALRNTQVTITFTI